MRIKIHDPLVLAIMLTVVLEEIKEHIVLAFWALGALVRQHHIHEASGATHQRHRPRYRLIIRTISHLLLISLTRHIRRRGRRRQRRRQPHNGAAQRLLLRGRPRRRPVQVQVQAQVHPHLCLWASGSLAHFPPSIYNHVRILYIVKTHKRK